MMLKNGLLIGVGAAFAVAMNQFMAFRDTLTGTQKTPTAEMAVAGNPAGSSSDTQSHSGNSKNVPSGDPIGNSRKNAVVSAVQSCLPSVVSINVQRSELVAYRDPYYDRFFDFFGPQYGKRQSGSLGSGVIVDHQGHIVTNSHVLGIGENGKLESVTVTLPDGRHFSAQVVGADPENDLAVLQIQAKDLPVAKLFSSEEMMLGEWAIAVGNPFGNLIGDPQPSVSLGVISALHRNFTSHSGIRFSNMIQTDAAVNPGNSGGALCNADGEVIGINTFIFTGGGESNGSIGLGFAIPILKAKRVVDELLTFGYIREFTTGLYAAPYIDPRNPGLIIAKIDGDSPAAKAGLKPGDLIITVAGRSITTLQDAQGVFKLFQVGELVEIGFRRGSSLGQAKMILEEAPRRQKNF